MGSIGLAIIYGFKVNVSVAIVAMVNHTAVKLSTLRQLESGNATNVITDIADQCHHHDISSNTTKITTEVYNLSSNFIKITNHEFVESFSRKNFWKKFRELNFAPHCELFFFFLLNLFKGWSIRVERTFTRPYPVILLLGIHGVFTSGGTNGRAVIRQMGDEWIGTSKRSGIYIITCCCTNALFPLYRDEVSSRNRWG